MVGVVLKFTGIEKNLIRTLLKNIDLTKKEIDIQFWESYGDSNCTYDLNEYEVLSSQIIMEELNRTDNEIYPEFIELFIRDKNERKKEITNYDSFLKSNYELSIITYDYRNIEICSKKEEYLLQIIKNFEESKLENKKIHKLYNINRRAILKAWRSEKAINIYD